MAEHRYTQTESGYEYTRLEGGFRYTQLVSTTAPPPTTTPPVTPYAGFGVYDAFLLEVRFDAAGTDVERFSYGHPSPHISNNLWRPDIIEPLSVSSNIVDNVGTLNRNITRNAGSIVIAIYGDLNDPLIDKDWQLASFTWYQGKSDSFNFGDFVPQFNGFISQYEVTQDRIKLTLDDGSSRLGVETVLHRYAGTGAQPDGSDEGPAELLNTAKPRWFGYRRNVAPVLVNAALNIYQIHFGSVDAVLNVYDMGAEIPTVGDVTDLPGVSRLHDWTPVAGFFAMDRRYGLIRLGSPPAGTVTVEAIGDNAGAFPFNNPIGILDRLMSLYSPPDIGFLRSEHSAIEDPSRVAGIYLAPDDERALSELVSDVAVATCTFWSISTMNRLTLTPVDLGAPLQGTLDEHDVLIDPVPISLRNERPIYEFVVQYDTNDRVMTEDEIVNDPGNPDIEAFKEYALSPGLEAISRDQSIKDANPRARRIVLKTILTSPAEAGSLATDLRGFSIPDHKLLKFSLVNQLFTINLGEVWEVVAPIIGSDIDRRGIIVSKTETVESRETNFTLLGLGEP